MAQPSRSRYFPATTMRRLQHDAKELAENPIPGVRWVHPLAADTGNRSRYSAVAAAGLDSHAHIDDFLLSAKQVAGSSPIRKVDSRRGQLSCLRALACARSPCLLHPTTTLTPPLCHPPHGSAEPLDGDLTTWVVNMVALEGLCAYYPVHLHLLIPPEYPDLPPQVRAYALCLGCCPMGKPGIR